MMTSESYLSYFTPGQMSHETLEFILVKRQKLIERLVERVRSSVLTAAKHQSILLGPRGMGKSHVVALVYHRIKALPDLADKVVLAWLAEEEWGVASLTDLFLVILKALAREYPQSNLQKDIDSLYNLPTEHVGDRAAQMIREFASGRTLFLLIENLEEIFRGLGEEGQWAFRSFLSERPFVTILATTPSLFTAIQKQQQAFYGFFQDRHLDELSAEEATELLGKVAERRGDTRLTNFLKTTIAQDRVQAIHDLAGGHPRIYLLFAHLITQESLDELVSPFLQLLDELTPYYQSRMQLLSPQQRKIIESLCNRRGATTVKDLAAVNLLTPQITAKQLGDLERMGYARKTAVGRESFYELREPLLRMVIEVKRGRNKPIRLIIDFLRRWYTRNERRERLDNVPATALLTRQYWEAALDLDLAMQDTPSMQGIKTLRQKFSRKLRQGETKIAAEIAASIIEKKGSKANVNDLIRYAYCLDAIGDFHKAIDNYKKAVLIRPDIYYAWIGLGDAFNNVELYSESLDSYENAIGLSPYDSDLWKSHGKVLNAMNQHIEALQSFDKAIEINQEDAFAWYGRGRALRGIKKYDLALKSFEKAIEIDHEDPYSWNGRGRALTDLERYVDALESFDRAIEIEPKAAFAWNNRGVALTAMGLYSEAMQAYDNAAAIEPNSARLKFNRGEIFLLQKKWSDFIDAIVQGFSVSNNIDDFRGDTEEYCRALLKNGWINEPEKVAELILIYAQNSSLYQLANGLIWSLPTLFEPEITQARAESWLAAWNAAGEGKPEFEIPLRLLAAAVAWKPKRDVRALLALPIEERRILEQLLPKDESEATGK